MISVHDFKWALDDGNIVNVQAVDMNMHNYIYPIPINK